MELMRKRLQAALGILVWIDEELKKLGDDYAHPNPARFSGSQSERLLRRTGSPVHPGLRIQGLSGSRRGG
jgi:hypothetical protein